jgi:Uma2 family endonuclease
MLTAKPGLSLDEFLRLPEREPPLEYEDGEVTQKVSPKHRHSRIQTRLAVRIESLPESTDVIASVELRVTFGGRSVVPDVSVFRRGRVPVDAAGEVENDVPVPPDVVFEVVSPKQSLVRLFRRCIWYVNNGVGAAVLIDDQDRSILLFRSGAEPRVLRGKDVLALGDIVPGFAVSADELFASLKV